jgi:lipopolysaccharide transport system permease protein
LTAVAPNSSITWTQSAVESFKHAFLGVGTVSLLYTSISVALTLVVLFLGLVLFSRAERTFVDTV